MSLTDRDTHFEFGENWRDYARSIDDRRISAAVDGLKKLFPEGLAEKRVLDIGCGSGLHALAALSLGAESVHAVDIDENSAVTTFELLADHVPGEKWKVTVDSVFDLAPDNIGTFDVVYSWGVLHHTGDMWRAIEKASALVRPGGSFAIAIYAATRLRAAWTLEKRLYSRAPKLAQWLAQQLYMAAYLSRISTRGINPVSYVKDYTSNRGMNFTHDVHDWLGGYPYEAATAGELHDRIEAMGFSELRSFRLPFTVGLFGAGCHEFVFARCGTRAR
jgi:2-polyprenyl-3-methyl-5-hydroxy-6-metoxy-1,4-benzoquinol methylase